MGIGLKGTPNNKEENKNKEGRKGCGGGGGGGGGYGGLKESLVIAESRPW